MEKSRQLLIQPERNLEAKQSLLILGWGKSVVVGRNRRKEKVKLPFSLYYSRFCCVFLEASFSSSSSTETPLSLPRKKAFFPGKTKQVSTKPYLRAADPRFSSVEPDECVCGSPNHFPLFWTLLDELKFSSSSLSFLPHCPHPPF